MNKIPHRLISLLLALSITANLCPSPSAPCRSQLTSAEFQREALPASPLSHRSFWRKPCTTFWSEIQSARYSEPLFTHPWLSVAAGSVVMAAAAAYFFGMDGIRWVTLGASGSSFAVLSAMGANPNGAEIVTAAKKAAIEVYSRRESFTNTTDLAYARDVADLYTAWTQELGLDPDPKTLAASYLIRAANDKECAQALAGVRPAITREIMGHYRRIHAGFTIPFDPPKGKFVRKAYSAQSARHDRRLLDPPKGKYTRRAISNQMAHYGKRLETLDELLIVVAMKFVILKDKRTNPVIRKILFTEFTQVTAPLLARLGNYKLSLKLIDQAYEAVDPDRFTQMKSEVEAAIGMDIPSAEAFAESQRLKIQSHMPEGCAVVGWMKSIYSTSRKRRVKSALYPTTASLEDLIRYAVIAKPGIRIEHILARISEALPGRLTKSGVPILRTMPGYDAWYVTFVDYSTGHEIPHEFQIFSSPEEYHRYLYAWPGAHWAYSLSQSTGAYPDFEPVYINPGDPRGNFKGFRQAIEPYTYFWISFSESHADGTRFPLIPSRIPRFAGARGTYADALSTRALLTRDVSGAITTQRTFNAAKGIHARSQTKFRPVELGDMLEEGSVVREATGALISSEAKSAILKKATFMGTFLDLSLAPRRDPRESISQGGERVLEKVKAVLKTRKPPAAQLGSAEYRDNVLIPVAMNFDLPDPEDVLATFRIQDASQHFRTRQEMLWKQLQAATVAYGAQILSTPTQRVWNDAERRHQRRLDDVEMRRLREKIRMAALKNAEIGFQDQAEAHYSETICDRLIQAARHEGVIAPSASALLLEIGLGSVSPVLVAKIRHMALGPVVEGMPTPELAPAPVDVADEPDLQAAPLLPPPPMLPITIRRNLEEDRGDSYVLDVILEVDQPAIMAVLVEMIVDHGFRLIEWQTLPAESGAFVRLVLERNEIVSIDELVLKLQERQIPITEKRLGPTKNVLASLQISNDPESIKAIFANLTKHMPDVNFPWFLTDQDEASGTLWLNFSAAFPVDGTTEEASSPKARLFNAFKAMGPLIQQFEIGPFEMSRQTAIASANLLDSKSRGNLHRLLEGILAALVIVFPAPEVESTEEQPLILNGEPGQDVPDEEVLELFTHADAFMKRIHSVSGEGEKRVPETRLSGEDYITHPISVMGRVVRWGLPSVEDPGPGTWDPVILIAALLHDVLENGPKNMFRRQYPDEEVPRANDPRMMAYRDRIKAEIRRTFPTIQHRLIYIIEHMTNYKLAGYALYGQRFRDEAGILMQALKLADSWSNLRSVFVTHPKKPYFARTQIAKYMRFMLPIVSTEPPFKNRMYKNSRLDFLKVLIRQTEKLTDEQFLKPYYEEGEDKQRVHQELALTIDDFLEWAENNKAWLEPALMKEPYPHFKARLATLRATLIPGIRTARFPRHVWQKFRELLTQARDAGKISQQTYDQIVTRSEGVAHLDSRGQIVILEEALPYLLEAVHRSGFWNFDFSVETLKRYLIALETVHSQVRAVPWIIPAAVQRLKDPELYLISSEVSSFDDLKRQFSNNYGKEFLNDELFVEELLSIYLNDILFLGDLVKLLPESDDLPRMQRVLPGLVGGIIIEFINRLKSEWEKKNHDDRQTPTLLVDSNDPSRALTGTWFGGAELQQRLSFEMEVNTSDVLRGALHMPGIGPVADLTIRDYKDGSRVQGPILNIRQAHKLALLPYVPPIFRVLLRWLKSQGFKVAEFRIKDPKNLDTLVQMLLTMQTSPDSNPSIILEADETDHFLTIRLSDYDFGPHGKGSPRSSNHAGDASRRSS